MAPYTVTRIQGLDRQEHCAVVAVVKPHTTWTVALCGPTRGAFARESEREANLFADAPAMLDLIQRVHAELAGTDLASLPGPGKLDYVNELLERADSIVSRHAGR